MFSGPVEMKANMILRNTASGTITCYWCRKVAALSDGQRTLKDIADFLYLPLPVAKKLALKGIKAGWLGVGSDLNSPSAEGYVPEWVCEEIEQVLAATLGEKSQPLFLKAVKMTKQEPGRLVLGSLPSVLIALELLLSDEERPRLIADLDSLRERYAETEAGLLSA